jgi:hypothetical protein
MFLVEINESDSFQRVLQELSDRGFLLMSDAALPSVTGIVAQEPIRGSWWGHPKGREIFAVSEQLSIHPDVLVTKLVSGKVTFIHRPLWPALVQIAASLDAWQLDNISGLAKSLLLKVTQDGVVRTDLLNEFEAAKPKELGRAVRELENRLLVYSGQIHTESGAHARVLESWERWAGRTGFVMQEMSVEFAKNEFETRLEELNLRFRAKGELPWKAIKPKRGRR